MISHENPEAMTTDQRENEIVRILSAGLVRSLKDSRKTVLKPAQNELD